MDSGYGHRNAAMRRGHGADQQDFHISPLMVLKPPRVPVSAAFRRETYWPTVRRTSTSRAADRDFALVRAGPRAIQCRASRTVRGCDPALPTKGRGRMSRACRGTNNPKERRNLVWDDG